MKDKIQNLKENWGSLNFNKKALLSISGVAAISAASFLTYQGLKSDFDYQLSNLDGTEVKDVLSAFDAESVTYKVDSQGSVYIDSSNLNKVNMLLAKHELPIQKTFGYDHLRSDSNIYVSQTKEGLFKKQVYEENIQASIESIDSVKSAKVQLALSKESNFLRDVAPATASVILTMNRGSSLTKQQVDGVVHLVSSAIPNLTKDNVVVLDNSGRMLTNGGDDQLGASSNQLDMKRNVEKEISNKITEIITPVIGYESFRVNVSADLNFDKVENTKEEPLSPTLVLSEQREVVYKEGSDVTGGVPGALSNQPPDHADFDENPKEGAFASNKEGVKNERYTKNYTIGKSITHTRFSVGNLNSISIAVLFDDSNKDEEELENIKREISELISASSGFNEDRGDLISVVSMPFLQDAQTEDENTSFIKSIYNDFKGLFSFLIGLFIVWLMFWRPIISMMRKGNTDTTDDNSSTQEEPEPVKNSPRVTINHYEVELNKVIESVDTNPDVGLEVFHGWLESVDFEDYLEDEELLEENNALEESEEIKEGDKL